jgi:hypothetical protein
VKRTTEAWDFVPWAIDPDTAIIQAMDTREIVGWAAVGLSGLTAFLYLLIGLNAVTVGDNMTPTEQRAFGFPAAAVFIGGAIVAVLWDQRWLWIVGAVGLALIIMMYFNLASERDPRFEFWGILIRVAQLPLLASLVYLAFTRADG